MELIFAIIVIVLAIMSENAKKQKRADRQLKNILEVRTEQQSGGRVNPGSAFEQARQRAFQNQRAQQRAQSEASRRAPDPGRVSAQSVAQTRKQAAAQHKAAAKSAMQGDILMRPVVTRREKFERSSAYEHSNRMDVQYTTNGCGCTTGKGNASSGKAHGFSSAMYDENRFFKESREICSGKWS